MKWDRILPLALSGIAIGLIRVSGSSFERFEMLLWVALSLALWAPVLSRARVPKPFLHGFVTGILASAAAGVVIALFISTFTANHPGLMEQLAQDNRTLTQGQMQQAFVMLYLFQGLLIGGLGGVAAWSFSRSRARREAWAEAKGGEKAEPPVDPSSGAGGIGAAGAAGAAGAIALDAEAREVGDELDLGDAPVVELDGEE